MTRVRLESPPGVPQTVATAEFDAPRLLVFRAFLEPDLLSQWLGPRRMTMTIDEFDPRDGGRYRYAHHDAQGNHYTFHGVFHGDPTLDSVVQTFEYEGAPGHVSLDTMILEERGGRTSVRITSIYQSVEDRDAMLAAGMETGIREGMERLEKLLERLERQSDHGASRAA
ncbi:MAG: SRPBCC family protein [Actinobacteria bacterium]|nr:SRPBCC family protein [Actinomycetota bacterium]